MRSRVRSVALVKQLGPGLITGAADDDPSGIATYSQAGAQFGMGLLWTMLLTFPLMVSVQMISAQIGRVTGAGLAKNMGEALPKWLVTLLLVGLFFANTINIGADLSAMGAAAQLVTHISQHYFTIGFALLSLVLQLFIPYRKYARVLTVLTLSLFSYVAVLFMVKLDPSAIVRGAVGLDATFTKDAIATIVAVFGTTISPYLFFWQSAQEVEEVNQDNPEKPLLKAPKQAKTALSRIALDTVAGMAMSNIVAIIIIIATAATLHAAGTTNIQTAADAAKALEPAAGKFAFLLFSVGIVGTGLLAVPVLAGSTAYAIGEARGWKTGLDHKPWDAIGFYGVIAAAVILGIAIDYSGLDPIKALIWSAIVNGVIAVPIMAAMMVVARHKRMGQFRIGPVLTWLGWLSTVVMGVAALALLAV